MSLNNRLNQKHINGVDNIPNSNNPGTENGDKKMNDPSFECSICLDSPTDAVVSMCGHLFCWPCLHRWLKMKPGFQVCPVCNSAIGKETVVPIYGRENPKQIDPRENLSPRPTGHRTERIERPTSRPVYAVYSRGEVSSNIAFLLEDLFGILPPINDILDSRSSTTDSSIFSSEYTDDLNY